MDCKILAKAWPYVSWQWTAIFSVGTTDWTASNIFLKVPNSDEVCKCQIHSSWW